MNDLDLYAEYQNQENESVEVDLDFVDSYDEALTEAREEMDMDNGDDDPELMGVTAYAADGDLQALANKLDWTDLWCNDKEEVVKDFLGLDEWQQKETLILVEYHGISLRQAMDELGDAIIIMAHTKEKLFDDWLETNEVPDHVMYYIDRDKVIDDNYHIMTRLQSGTVVATYR